MSAAVEPWAAERAAWLLAHSRPGTSRRRRAELLGQQARRDQRAATGVSDSGMHEDVTPPLFRRLTTTDDGTGEKVARAIGVPLLFAGVFAIAGPGMLGTKLLYRRAVDGSVEHGHLKPAKWYLAGVALAVLGALLCWLIKPVVIGVHLWTGPIEVHWLPWLLVTLWIQGSIALLGTALWITENGWAGVKSEARPLVAAPKKDDSGQWIATPDNQKINLDYVDDINTSKEN